MHTRYGIAPRAPTVLRWEPGGRFCVMWNRPPGSTHRCAVWGGSGVARVAEYLIYRIVFAFFECGFLTDAVYIHILSAPPLFSQSQGRESESCSCIAFGLPCLRLAVAQGGSGAARVTEYLISRVDFDFFECGFLTDVVCIHIRSDPPTFFSLARP